MIPEAASKLSYQFLVGFFVPAALLTGAVALCSGWAPHAPSSGGSSLDIATIAGTVFVVSAALAVFLQMFSPFLIRVFEGASGIPASAARLGRKHWARQLRDLTRRIKEFKDKDTEASLDEAYRLERERFLRFPSREQDVLPTELGNVIAAWEHYPYRRYGIDTITLWPRLAPLLSRPVSDAIVSAKARFDLLFNALILLPVWGVLRATVLVQPGETWRRWVWLLASLAATFPIWRLCLAAAGGWGDTVKAAFDLHRLDVLKQMGVADSAATWSSDEERALWREVQWTMKFDYVSSLRVAPRREPAKTSSTEPDRPMPNLMIGPPANHALEPSAR